jgi:gluconokinase
MGVSGSGKSEIGTRLALELGVTYIEGDDYHTPSNLAKMAHGVPLDDADRREWLQSLQRRISAAKQRGESLVLTCSALKRRYRDFLRQGDPDLVFIHLVGDSDLIALRMRARLGHFMPLALLESQYRDLEPPQDDESVISLDIRKPPVQLVSEIVRRVPAAIKGKRDGDLSGSN